jgi:site-specific DNA-methyltransferase (adenine-specific)
VKPYYQRKGITIYLGNCRKIAPKLEGVDLILSDPPYGVKWDTDYSIRCRPKSTLRAGYRPNFNGTKYPPVFGDDKPFDPSPWLGFKYVILWGANCYSNRLPMGRWIIWDKRFDSGKSFFSSDAEVAWMKGGHGVRIYQQRWQGCTRSDAFFHPTQKPLLLMEWCIGHSLSKRAILDPYMGSGTTLLAARNLKREAIGIEIEERYCEIAAQRLEGLKVKKAA